MSRAYRAKKTAIVSMRIMLQFQRQLKVWANRSGITYTEFLTMSLVHGARKQARILGVYRQDDDIDYDLMDVNSH